MLPADRRSARRRSRLDGLTGRVRREGSQSATSPVLFPATVGKRADSGLLARVGRVGRPHLSARAKVGCGAGPDATGAVRRKRARCAPALGVEAARRSRRQRQLPGAAQSGHVVVRRGEGAAHSKVRSQAVEASRGRVEAGSDEGATSRADGRRDGPTLGGVGCPAPPFDGMLFVLSSCILVYHLFSQTVWCL